MRGRRSRRNIPLRKKFLVVTDGVVTEEGYFTYLKQLAQDTIIVIARQGKDIDAMLRLAINTRDKAGDYSYVAIVCDIDERLRHLASKERLERAVRDCNREGILLCLSHESFEVWLLAHVEKVKRGAAARGVAQQMALKAGLVSGGGNKVVNIKMITDQSIKNAIEESRRLRRVYGPDILKNAPLTDVDLLVEKISLR